MTEALTAHAVRRQSENPLEQLEQRSSTAVVLRERLGAKQNISIGEYFTTYRDLL